MKTTRIPCLLALSALLAACGGGGDGGPAPATTPAATGIPLATAMANLTNQSKTGSVSITGTVSASGQTVNVSGSGTYTETTTAGSFEGVQGLRKHLELAGTVSASGQTAPISSSTDAYYDSNYKPLGATGPGSYCLTTSYTALPASVQPGSAGNWFTQDCYTSSAKLAKTGSGTASYSVEADGPGTAVVRFNTRVTDSAGNTIPTTASYRVTSTGATTRLTDVASFSVSGATFNLTVAYQ